MLTLTFASPDLTTFCYGDSSTTFAQDDDGSRSVHTPLARVQGVNCGDWPDVTLPEPGHRHTQQHSRTMTGAIVKTFGLVTT
jgi:hypothetical protein